MTETELAEKVCIFYESLYDAFWEAGGNPSHTLSLIPTEVILILASNDIRLVYKRVNK